MSNLHELFNEATTAAPPSRLSVDDVFTAIRSRRRRRHLQNMVVSIAAVAIAAAGGIVVSANFAGHPPVGAAPPGPVIWTARGDSMHLYLVRDNCERNPSSSEPDSASAVSEEACNELVASSDGGATWVSRGAVVYPPTILGPLTLMRFAGSPAALRYTGPPATVEPQADVPLPVELSADGGATWRQMLSEGTPVESVPPGGTMIAADRRLTVYDPAQGRLRPLAHQPTLRRSLGQMVFYGPRDIWVSGLNPATLKPAVAVSHDAGATWTERDLPGVAAIPQPTLPNGELDPNASYGNTLHMIVGDGTTAYAAMWDGSPEPAPKPQLPGITEDLGWLRTYRTTDGGVTWHAVADESTTPSYARSWSAPGGRIVFSLVGFVGAAMGLFAVSTDCLTYAPAVLPGLPPSLTFIDGSTAHSGDAMYVSDDGWTWREVWHD